MEQRAAAVVTQCHPVIKVFINKSCVKDTGRMLTVEPRGSMKSEGRGTNIHT